MQKALEKLLVVQQKLKAPKDQDNDYGKYKYRSAEQILEAVKPILKELNCVVVLDDEIVNIGDRYYIKATATLYDTENGESISNHAYARESETKKGMDDSQITGTASSYARKYCMNGLFGIDDTKDADTNEYRNETTKKAEIAEKSTPQDLPPEVQAELTENASEFEIDNFKQACEQAGLNYKEIWTETGKPRDMSKAHLGKAMLLLKDKTNG